MLWVRPKKAKKKKKKNYFLKKGGVPWWLKGVKDPVLSLLSQVTAGGEVQSLAPELLHATGKKKKRWWINKVYDFFAFFGGGGHTHDMPKFWGQGSNTHHSSDPSHSNGNTRSLTHWATREFLHSFVFIIYPTVAELFKYVLRSFEVIFSVWLF